MSIFEYDQGKTYPAGTGCVKGKKVGKRNESKRLKI